VLASAECFASINYEAMLKDPAPKGCTLQVYEINDGDRFVGIKYKQRNVAPASRYFTKFEPIVIKRKSNL